MKKLFLIVVMAIFVLMLFAPSTMSTIMAAGSQAVVAASNETAVWNNTGPSFTSNNENAKIANEALGLAEMNALNALSVANLNNNSMINDLNAVLANNKGSTIENNPYVMAQIITNLNNNQSTALNTFNLLCLAATNNIEGEKLIEANKALNPSVFSNLNLSVVMKEKVIKWTQQDVENTEVTKLPVCAVYFSSVIEKAKPAAVNTVNKILAVGTRHNMVIAWTNIA